jgi:hypothetical protein
MAERSNALSEITRFWLHARLGCLVDEAIPVSVPYGTSDIDLAAMRPDLTNWTLPDGASVKRAIVETKDEHDWDATGREFGRALRSDVALMGAELTVPARLKGVKFTMLRQEHFDTAARYFGTDDFDRVFVVHALDLQSRQELCPALAQERNHWLTVKEVVQDLLVWYTGHSRPATLRHTLVGDLWHLLVGYRGLRIS